MILQPTKHALGRIHDVVLPLMNGAQSVDIGVNEGSRQPDFLRQLVSAGDRFSGEIDTGNCGAMAYPRQRVRSDVALKMK